MGQTVEALAADHAAQIEEQREWVRGHYAENARHKYASVDGKLRLLEAILAQGWVRPDETWKLQSLGVTLGDALAQELELQWVTVEDEYGRDPALQVPGTSILVFPLTMISKRVEDGEVVDVRDLFESACETIADLRAKGR